jgi:4-amino-4-deoxy-L-arabinose transferase-like glycosyltransferase
MAARREWINEIYQGKVYHQEPMYVYLLAATYRLFGLDPNWIYLWQLLLGACTNVLVFLIGRRYFGSLTGLLAAVVVTGFRPYYGISDDHFAHEPDGFFDTAATFLLSENAGQPGSQKPTDLWRGGGSVHVDPILFSAVFYARHGVVCLGKPA